MKEAASLAARDLLASSSQTSRAAAKEGAYGYAELRLRSEAPAGLLKEIRGLRDAAAARAGDERADAAVEAYQDIEACLAR
jgi:hypothetical protein